MGHEEIDRGDVKGGMKTIIRSRDRADAPYITLVPPIGWVDSRLFESV